MQCPRFDEGTTGSKASNRRLEISVLFVIHNTNIIPLRHAPLVCINCISFQSVSASTTRSQRTFTRFCPDYLRQSVHFYTPSRHLRSTYQLLLTKPTTRTVISSRAFSRAAPTIWNSLPYHIHTADSFGQFTQSLRTHLYSLAFH